jgi:D-inositol-3-phosphate glycosyltransferase
LCFPSYYESFGLVPLESLACGIPVVATNVGDLQNIIREGETGYILRDSEPQRLAGKLEAILSGNATKMGDPETIRSSVIRFGWQNIAANISSEFDSVVAREPVRTY